MGSFKIGDFGGVWGSGLGELKDLRFWALGFEVWSQGLEVCHSGFGGAEVWGLWGLQFRNSIVNDTKYALKQDSLSETGIARIEGCEQCIGLRVYG